MPSRQCDEYTFSCPIEQIGDEFGNCTWTVKCCDGEKINIKLKHLLIYEKIILHLI